MFPNELQLAQMMPMYKKDDPLLKQNYRPVSVLPSLLSKKLFEGKIKEMKNKMFGLLHGNMRVEKWYWTR